MKNEFIKKYEKNISGVLSCYDRVVIKGTLHTACFADGMMSIMNRNHTKYKYYRSFVSPYRDKIYKNTEQLSKQTQVPIQFIRNSRAVRKEDLVQSELEIRGNHPGLVCILSAMEKCNNYRYNYNKQTGESKLISVKGRCLHYYFYFLDDYLGLCYLRVPTWCPFQLQFYFNAHNWLALQLDKAGIAYEQRDNAFVHIADYEKAQSLSDSFDVKKLHQLFENYALKYCPSAFELSVVGYHWSIMQLEYATDIVFKDAKTLGPIYDEILKTMMHTVTPDDVARFLGRKYLHGKNKMDLDTTYKQVKRQEMRRLKHVMGASSVKMYDKFGQVLRIETTTNDTTNFSHYRSVDHRDGTKTSKVAPVKKSIYSLKGLIPIMKGCNFRYLTFIAAIDAPISGQKRLQKITKSTKVNNRSYKGFNFFDPDDEKLLFTIAKGDFCIKGFSNKDLRKFIPDKSTAQISRILKRLKVKGLIKKIGKSYRYYMSTLGRKTVNTALKIKELFIVQNLDYA